MLSSKHLLTGPQNFKSLKYWVNNEPGFMAGLFYSTKIFAKNLTKGHFAQNLKDGPDIYKHVKFVLLIRKCLFMIIILFTQYNTVIQMYECAQMLCYYLDL